MDAPMRAFTRALEAIVLDRGENSHALLWASRGFNRKNSDCCAAVTSLGAAHH
jgi:hypothetical protein